MVSDKKIKEEIAKTVGDLMTHAMHSDDATAQHVDAMRMMAAGLPDALLDGVRMLRDCTSMTTRQAVRALTAAALAGGTVLRDAMEKEGWKPG